MGTKTQTEGYIETILHENENGAGNDPDADNGYSTTEPPADDPTPLTTPAEEAARADEFPSVIQAGMWVQTTQEVEAGADIVEAGVIGQVFIDAMNACSVAVNQGTNYEFYFPLGIVPGDPLPDFLEQVNAPEPAFDETMKHTTAPVHPAPYSSLPDSTPLDDLDGENAKPSEAGTVYTTATTATATQATSANLEELANIYDLAADADRISLRLDDAKAVVKELREELDEANSKLRAAALALKWSREPEPELFRQRDVASEEALTGDIAGAELDAAADKLLQSPATPDESWRLISIDALDLPGKIPEQLREHHPSLDTIGAIVDFVNTPFTYLTDVKGIGQGKAEKIADALESFWKNRNAKPTNTPDPTSTEQGTAAFDSGMTLDDNPHPRGSSDWDDWRAGFKAQAGMGDGDEAVGDEDL